MEALIINHKFYRYWLYQFYVVQQLSYDNHFLYDNISNFNTNRTTQGLSLYDKFISNPTDNEVVVLVINLNN